MNKDPTHNITLTISRSESSKYRLFPSGASYAPAPERQLSITDEIRQLMEMAWNVYHFPMHRDNSRFFLSPSAMYELRSGDAPTGVLMPHIDTVFGIPFERNVDLPNVTVVLELSVGKERLALPDKRR